MADNAALARQFALHCEARKIAYRQSKDGMVVSFVIHPSDMPATLATADIGTRYMLAMVEIGDDETPVQPKESAQPRPPDEIPTKAGGAKKNWQDMAPAQQAGILSNEGSFIAFLEEQWPLRWSSTIGENSERAASCIRSLCKVSSRANIIPGTEAADFWHNLVSEYRAWMREPEVIPA